MASARDGKRSRLAAAAGRVAFFPARAAARASRDQLGAAADELAPELARVLDRAFAGSMPEELARSLAKHRVLERMAGELASSGAFDHALDEALKSPRTGELTDRIVHSPEMRRAIREVVASPEVRQAITQQTSGLAEELVDSIRERAVELDSRIENAVHSRPRAARSRFAGVATRAAALAIDAALIVAIFVTLSALVALISSLVGTLRPKWLVGILAAAGGALLAGGYLTLFWSATGQTPGMRLLRLRVRRPAGGPPSLGRALVRVVGTVVAIVPFFAGYLPVLFDERRRGLPDLVAGTEVVYDDPEHPWA